MNIDVASIGLELTDKSCGNQNKKLKIKLRIKLKKQCELINPN